MNSMCSTELPCSVSWHDNVFAEMLSAFEWFVFVLGVLWFCGLSYVYVSQLYEWLVERGQTGQVANTTSSFLTL